MLNAITEFEVEELSEIEDRPDTFIKRTGDDGGARIGYLGKDRSFVDHHDFKDGDVLIDTSKDTAGNRFTFSEEENKWIPDSENVKAKSNARPMVMNADGNSLVTDKTYSNMSPDDKMDFNSRD